MQEEVTQETIALVFKYSRLTADVLKKAMKMYLEHRKAGKQTTHGKMSVKKLVGQNQGVSNVELSGEDIKAFERVARKYGVDYAVKKVKGDAPRFLIFFKARDADALNAALSEYIGQKMRGKEHDRLREKLRAPIEQIITHKKQREQSR